MTRLLAIDDDEGFVFGLRGLLRRDGCEVAWAPSGRMALGMPENAGWDAILLDLGLPDMPGLEVLRALSRRSGSPPVIVLSGRDEVAVAVEALRLGAKHYLTKPPGREGLLRIIAEVRENEAPTSELALRGSAGEVVDCPDAAEPNGILGASQAWLAAVEDLRAAATSPSTPVLITGESGTGKELAAALIHQNSARVSRPFVALNTACFSPALLENELFGHEAGAFTGACGTKRGAFELAAGGTLFLDEIGEMPLELQPKLLRVLEGHPFRRLGGERPISVSFRLVSATNRKLDEAVQQGKFRLDLYHRLRVVEVTLPPLRERGEDIELLAYAFLSKLTAALGKPELELAPEALRAICAYRWPGNVRELRNAIERAVILCKGPRVLPSDLPPEIRCAEPSLACGSAGMPPPRSAGVVDLELDHVVREHILLVYGECGESVAKAAKKLGIGRATLRRKLRDYRVIPADPSQPRRP